MEASSLLVALRNLRKQLQKSTADYSKGKDTRGSSPTESLAADISQNFRLDSDGSPRFPNPRRALFQASTMGGIDGRNSITTPRVLLPGLKEIDEYPETASSPPKGRRSCSASNPMAPALLGLRPRTHFASVGAPGRNRQGCSIECDGHRLSKWSLRNRRQVRRSLSMFERLDDVMKPEAQPEDTASSTRQLVVDSDEPTEPVLPHFLPDDPADTIPRISRQTLLEVLDGRYGDKFDQKMVIDCRFEYEYEGGHIDGAVNYNDKDLLASQLFKTPMSGRTLLIFHCEYSAYRAPLMARHVRSEDRTFNAGHYPKLTYPEVYILDGGYSGFFSKHRGRCYPPGYVAMSDSKHQRTCEREMGRLKSRKSLGRAQTFAFGQWETFVDESPTSPGHPSPRQATMSLLGDSPCPVERIQFRAERLAV